MVHNARRRGKGQSRILYWFRTPPGVRVGRSAIDEDAIRLLEQHNPDVQFDWTHILKPAPPTMTAEAPRDRDRGSDVVERRGQRRVERRAFPRPGDAQSRRLDRWTEPVASPDVQPPDVVSHESGPSTDRDDTPFDSAAPPLGDELVRGGEEPVVELPAEDRTSAAYQRLGSEGLARLRARYAEVMARIAERPMEDAAREELKLRAERLNPDGWVTTEEVQHALEQYESVFEGLRALVGTRRRRRRRRAKTQGS